MLEDNHIRRAAFWINEEIRRRQRFNQPIPQSLRETLDALNRGLSKNGHDVGGTRAHLSRLKTQEQLADELGCCTRTVRRRAEALGWRKFNGYILDEGQHDRI